MIKKKNYFKNFIIAIIFFVNWSLCFKNHDDFSYYHLTYSLNLSENSFIVGTGNFSHGFRTFSSLFYFHSTLYMPYVEYFLFHIGPFYILIFFNFIIIHKLILKFEQNYNNSTYYFSLISLIFVNIVFYRLSEHGTDRSAQILLFLIFLLFIEILRTTNRKIILTNIGLLSILISLAASMKAIYYFDIIFFYYQ